MYSKESTQERVKISSYFLAFRNLSFFSGWTSVCLPGIQAASCHYLILRVFAALNTQQKEGQFYDYLKLQPFALYLRAFWSMCCIWQWCLILNPQVAHLTRYDSFMTAEDFCVLLGILDQL